MKKNIFLNIKMLLIITLFWFKSFVFCAESPVVRWTKEQILDQALFVRDVGTSLFYAGGIIGLGARYLNSVIDPLAGAAVGVAVMGLAARYSFPFGGKKAFNVVTLQSLYDNSELTESERVKQIAKCSNRAFALNAAITSVMAYACLRKCWS